jgi:hypothetical protein
MAAALARAPSSVLSSRAPSFSAARTPSPHATPPLVSPRPGGAATPPAVARAAGGAGDADAVVAAASLILSRAAAAAPPADAAAATADSQPSAALPPLPPRAPPARRAAPPAAAPGAELRDDSPSSSSDDDACGSAVPRKRPRGAPRAGPPPPPLEPVQLSPGSFEAAYDAGELLGRGTFGDVRVATERATGRQAAVKVVPKALRGRSQREEVMREVAFCRRLQGAPGVVQLHGVYEVRRRRRHLVEGGRAWRGGERRASRRPAPTPRLTSALPRSGTLRFLSLTLSPLPCPPPRTPTTST